MRGRSNHGHATEGLDDFIIILSLDITFYQEYWTFGRHLTSEKALTDIRRAQQSCHFGSGARSEVYRLGLGYASIAHLPCPATS